MSINPYRPPEVELTQSKKRNETNRTRRYRGLVTLSRVCLLAYNVYFFCFIVCFSIGLPLQLLGGQRGLLVPEYVEVCVFLVMVPLAVMSVLGNWYVFGLALWLLAQKRSEQGWLRRLLFVVLLFVPVWGVRRFRLLVGSDDSIQ